MRTGILSIREPYASAIFSGEKSFEYRRQAPRLHGPTRFLIYVPTPSRVLAGEMVVERIISGAPSEVWVQTGARGGIDADAYQSYFAGRDLAHALVIRKAKRYRQARHLDDLRQSVPGGFTPPQFLQWIAPSALHAFA